MAPVNRPLDRAGMVSELKAIRIAYNVPEGEQPVRVVNSFKVASASDPKRVKKFPFAKEQRAWKCPECNRFLSSKRSFNEHMNIHSQKRPFACEFCEYSAASQMTLRRHVLRNHTPAQDWGYRCPYCPQVYMEPASYQQHVSSKHPGRSCTYGCPYKLCPFSSKCFRHFREHIRKHDASERFNGPTDRQPCTRSDQELIMYLVDDDIGTGYKGLSTSTTVIRRRVMTKPVKTVIYTNSLVHRGPPRLEEEEYYPEMEIDDFMKQPLSLLPRTSAPRTVEMEETGELIVDGEIMPADNDWIEQEIEIQDTQTAESRRIASISSKGRKTMMTLSGETVPDIILHSLPKSSLETNMNVDVGFGDSLLDAAPSSHTLSVEGRSPDEGESSTSNILKLSVGCEDSEDDLDYGDNGNLNAQLRSWRMQTGPSSSQFENDFDMELPSEQIKAMITGEEYMFPQTGQRDFAEEVFMVKEPKIVHGYLFGELIGEGSYSKVKEVIEEDSLVRRAIKIIKHNRVRKIPNGVENVQREIKILRKLKHKHVINLIETFRNEEKGKLYIVLEFCLGSLQRHIDSAPGGRLHEYEAHMYFVQLTEGLEYIHSKGIVHKDIKPGNLLLGPDLTLKISDFGVAEELPMFQPDDTCIIVQGTPKFQAPELVSGNTRTFKGFKSDIWSCGVTLFNMISGLYPFEGDAIMKLFENIAHEPLLMPSNVPVTDDLKVFLHGILDKNPLLRWNNDQIKHSTWFNRLFDQKEIDEFLSFKRTIHRPLTVSQGLEALFSDNASLKRGLSIPEVIMEEEIQVHIIPIHKDDPNIIHREIPIHIEPPPPPSRSSRRVFGCFAPSRSP